MARRFPLSIVVGLIAFAIPLVAATQVEYIDPAGGFTQVVTTTNAGVKTVFVSGQVGRATRCASTSNRRSRRSCGAWEQAGATAADVVKIRIFVKDFLPEQYPVISEVRLATFPEENQWPASTMIGVRELFAESLRVEIEAIAVVAEPGVNLEIERFAPSNGFSGAVAVTAHGVKTVYVAGHVGAGDTLATQTAAVWERVSQRLEAAGASLADMVKATTYIVDFDPEADLPAYRAGREAALVLADMPASTLLGIPALVAEQFRIEIDGIAVVGADGHVRRPGVHRSGHRLHAGRDGARLGADRGPGLRPGGSARRPPRPNQADQVYANLRRRLEAAGAAPEDLLKIVIYMPELHSGRLRGGRRGPQGARLPRRDGPGRDAARHPVALRDRRAAGDRRDRGRRTREPASNAGVPERSAVPDGARPGEVWAGRQAEPSG